MSAGIINEHECITLLIYTTSFSDGALGPRLCRWAGHCLFLQLMDSPKGQLVSKQNFGILEFFQKTNEHSDVTLESL